MTVIAPDQHGGLDVNGITTGYLGKDVVFEVSFHARATKVTGLFGHNGAGKTTTLMATAGLLPSRHGRVVLGDQDLTAASSSRRVACGLLYLPQEQAVFRTMTVRENLLLGGRSARSARQARLDDVIDLFPTLGDRLGQLAGTMSGGEQRMLSLGIALMAGARMLLLDEPSLGLAPVIYEKLLEAVRRLVADTQIGVVLVEQAVGPTLPFVDHAYVMRSGQIVASYTGAEARARDDWWRVF
jgi:branched-chain amino acid transport system ATP-binding protein